MSKRRSQAEHDTIVEMLANSLYARNRNPHLENVEDIRADIDGFKRPDVITLPGEKEGETPDATAMASQLWIYEIETADSVDDEHTERQWTLFAKFAEENDAIFHIAVPPMAQGDVKRRLKELSLKATVIPIP